MHDELLRWVRLQLVLMVLEEVVVELMKTLLEVVVVLEPEILHISRVSIKSFKEILLELMVVEVVVELLQQVLVLQLQELLLELHQSPSV